MFSRFPALANMFSAAHHHNGQPHQNIRNQSPPSNSRLQDNCAPAARGSPGRNSLDGQQQMMGESFGGGTQYLPNGEIDNSWAVMCKISSLYLTKSMSDITLVIGRREYSSHRLILCASSHVFQAMLMGSNWLETQLTRIELQETSECAEYFEDFLKYLYTGIIRLELSNVLHLLTLSDKYDIKDLVDLCLEYIIKNIPAGANHCKLIQWYKHLARRGHEKEAQACKNFIKWNFEFVATAADFCELDSKLLIQILLEDDLVVFDEYTLFQCVNKWIESQISKLEVEDPDLEYKTARLVQESMECIRFPMMSPRQLADLVLVPIAQQHKEYFMEKMAIGVAFHSDITHSMNLILQHPHRTKLFTPRHYCTDKWSICLTVDNFHSLSHYTSKTHVFSTPLSFSEKNGDKQAEWVVDLYPKGVCYSKFYLIVWQGTLECPDQVMKTVRLSIHCKNCDEDNEQPIRVQIGILIAGVENDVEHVKRVIKKNYVFSGRDKVLNFDDVVPYDELVRTLVPTVQQESRASPPLSTATATNYGAPPPPGGFPPPPSTGGGLQQQKSSYLCNDSLKLRIVITPMSEINI